MPQLTWRLKHALFRNAAEDISLSFISTAMKTVTLLISLGLTLASTLGRAAEPEKAKTHIVEALIDGPSELRVKKDGIYWINGENAKPGRHGGQEESCYVNGKSWRPVWKNARQERGVDRTATKNVEGIDPTKLEVKLAMVGISRKSSGIENRDAIRTSLVDGELSILIPDGQSGSRWYRLELTQRP